MIDVALDARRTPRMSVGTRAYVDALLSRAPHVASDLAFAEVGHGDHFGVAEQVALPLELVRLRPRLAHFMTPLAPLVRPVPYVVTVHDLIHVRHPELFGRGARAFYATLGRSVLHRAARLVMGDERTADDLARWFGIPRERCRIVPLGYAPELLARDDVETAPRPYVLYAGNHRPHKNLATLFAAFLRLPPALELDCYVTGPDDFAGALQRHVRPSGRILALGNVDAERLARLYRGAVAYVQPSLAEGFGIPMLEAAVVGTPVIASDSAVPAILAHVATTFPARDAAALGAALAAVARDPEGARRRAREVARPLRAYTWDRFAEATVAVYREILAQQRRR